MLNLPQILSNFKEQGVHRVFYKELAKNDNSKNQPYLGGSYDVISILPLGEISEYPSVKRKNFKCAINFSWLTDKGKIVRAPNSKIILYTKYPEVRFSGFIRGIQNSIFGEAPTRLMNLPRDETPERIMFFGVTNQRTIIGYVRESNQQIINHLESKRLETYGALTEIEVKNGIASEDEVINKLIQIRNRGWCRARYLRHEQNQIVTVEINSITNQCHGMTLEAEFDICHNSIADSDWRGWELKGKRVKNELQAKVSKSITLMTPEPDGGLYHSNFTKFIRLYGHKRNEHEDRIDFTGIHKYKELKSTTNLEMIIDGFIDGKIQPDGKIQLVDSNKTLAASWSFSKLLGIWNRKHQNIAIVPCIAQKHDKIPFIKYFGPVGIGRGTDFIKFLNSFISHAINLDPACRINPEKRRNQWRTTSGKLDSLYNSYKLVGI